MDIWIIFMANVLTSKELQNNTYVDYLHKERRHPGVEWQHWIPPPGLVAPELFQEPGEQGKKVNTS